MVPSTSNPLVSRIALAISLLSLGTTTAHAAPSAEVAGCIANSEVGQVARNQNRWLEARKALASCAREQCPAPIREACAEWAEELAPRIPTLLIEVKDEHGADVTAGTLSIDGVNVAGALSGAAVDVDPGLHTVRFETTSGPPLETNVLAREGQKRRLVRLVAPPSARLGAVSSSVSTPHRARSGPPVSSWLLAGLGTAALGTGAALGISGLVARSNLDECAPSCAQSDLDSARTRLLVSDITVGVGVVAIAAAAVLWILSPPRAAARKAHVPLYALTF